MDPYEGIDLAHLAECVDRHCCYCRDEEPAVTMDEQERAFLEALTRAA